MANKKMAQPSIAIFGILFTTIALVAFVALILVRSSAQFTEEGTQQQATNTAPVQMVIGDVNQYVYQGATDLEYLSNVSAPATPVDRLAILTPGSAAATPVHFVTTFRNMNSIPAVIQQNSALVEFLTVRHDAQVVGFPQAIGPFFSCDDLTFGGLDYNECWSTAHGGLSSAIHAGTYDPLTHVITDSTSPTETNGVIDISFSPQYFTRPGYWDAWIRITPVDGDGVARPDLALTNEALYVRWYVAPLVAISVVGPDGATAQVNYTKNSSSIAPGEYSDTEAIKPTQLGNVASYIGVYGTQWTSDQNASLHMNVNITHFDGDPNFTWSDSQSHDLALGSDNTTPTRVKTGGSTGTSVMVPEIFGGDQFGDVPVGAGEVTYYTKIHVEPGHTGTFSSSLTTVASDSHTFTAY